MNTPYVVIYRAAPMSANEFYDRDYVTLSKKFAIGHAENNHVYNEEPFHVIQALVSTKDIFDASNPGEYFYHGPNKKAKEIYVSLGPDEYEGLNENFQKKQFIDEIDDIANTISNNITNNVVIPNDVLNSFIMKSQLNPQIWKDDMLNPIIRQKLIKVANDFFTELNLPTEVKLRDIIFTGSLANFNWSKFSDIDLHLVLDFSKIQAEEKFKEDFFYAQKALWNQNHDITIYDFPIELYVQDIKAKLIASAVYSVKNNKWVLKPEKETFKLNKKLIKQKATRFIDKLKDIKKDYNENNLNGVLTKVKILKDKIKNYRTSGLEKEGEYAIENIVFKTLRRTPFMDVLDSYKAKAYDKLMSIKK
jgi:predicted nucleotidyltransferase